ncbi:hypothetical protein BHE74_00017644 [Ensete ventricosum]|nr:hypothetical protein BHE74_00017644 [Ensete ventricosum]
MLPCQGVATPTIGIATPAGGRATRERQPLAPPIGAASLPCELALVAAGHPFVGGLGCSVPWVAGATWGLAVAGRHSSSLP